MKALISPDRWAAIVPICGSGPKDIGPITGLPCWCFVGDQDRPALVENNRFVTAALKTAGARVRYTEYPGVGHNSWDRAYGTPELFTWMLKQHRK